MTASSAAESVWSALRKALLRPGGGIVVILVSIAVFATTQSPVFLTANNLFNIVDQTVILMILAIATTMVLIAGGIDLSIASILGLSGGVAAYLMSNGLPMPVAFVAALATGTSLGIVNGLVITKLGVPDFIATLAMLGFARGVLYVWTEAIPFRGYMTPFYYMLGGLTRLAGPITVSILIALVLAIVVAAVLRWTTFGRHIHGVGSNPDAARFSGVSIDRVKISVYATSGLLSAAAGILLAGRLTTVQPSMGEGFLLPAIGAAVMGGAALSGGKGSVFGAVMGALTLSTITNVINILNVNPYWQSITVGIIIILAVLAERVSSSMSRTRGEASTA